LFGIFIFYFGKLMGRILGADQWVAARVNEGDFKAN
jgi:hypothetical protein